MNNQNVKIISEDSIVTPPMVQDAIKTRFCFSKDKEVYVKKDGNEFDVYQKNKLVCSFDDFGNEI